MEAYQDNIENEINDLIDKLISELNERRERLLSILRIKRVELRAVQAVDKQVEQQLVEAKAALVSRKVHNKLQSMHKRMLNEVDTKINDCIGPSKELRFEGHTHDLETQISSLGEITVHELYVLPPIPQRSATPGVISKLDKDQPPSVRCLEFPTNTSKLSPHHFTEDPDEYPFHNWSLEGCETLRNDYQNIPSKTSPHHVTQDTKQYRFHNLSPEGCETLRNDYQNIPSKTSPHHVTQDTKQYLWDKMTRKDCEDILLQRAKQGEFIIRYSGSREGELVLSLRNCQTIYHFSIVLKDGWFCLGENCRVRSLPEIISHFKKTPIVSYKEHGNKYILLFLSQALQKN